MIWCIPENSDKRMCDRSPTNYYKPWPIHVLLGQRLQLCDAAFSKPLILTLIFTYDP